MSISLSDTLKILGILLSGRCLLEFPNLQEISRFKKPVCVEVEFSTFRQSPFTCFSLPKFLPPVNQDKTTQRIGKAYFRF